MPVAKAIPFGLQHILAMFVANIAPIIIVAAACGLSASESAGLGRDATTKETSGSIACDGFVSALSSVFGMPFLQHGVFLLYVVSLIPL